MPWCNVTMYQPPPAITRDGGASFPVVAGNTGTIGSVTTASFDVDNPAQLVAVLGFGNFDGGDRDPYTVSWNGGTPANATAWTKQVEGILAPGTHSASVWTATCSAALTGVSVTASGTSGSNTAISLAVDALLNTGGVGNSASRATAGNNSVAVTGVSAGSWIYVGGCFEAPGTVSPTGNTTELNEALIGGVSFVSATGADTSGNSGSITVGWGGTFSFGAIAALEILKV